MPRVLAGKRKAGVAVSADAYRSAPAHIEERASAETKVIEARAGILREIEQGLAIANEYFRRGLEGHIAYVARADALRRLYEEVSR